MNERLKELAAQAGLDAKEIRDDESLTLYAFEEFDIERFAELVRQDDRARKWVGLTDEEVLIATYELRDVLSVEKIIKLIEAKLKEKNGGSI